WGRGARGRPGPGHRRGRGGEGVRAVPAGGRRRGRARLGGQWDGWGRSGARGRTGADRGTGRNAGGRHDARGRTDDGADAPGRTVVKVLVVDDDPTLRRTLDIGLRAEGHEVLIAADGRTALQALREDR